MGANYSVNSNQFGSYQERRASFKEFMQNAPGPQQMDMMKNMKNSEEQVSSKPSSMSNVSASDLESKDMVHQPSIKSNNLGALSNLYKMN